jgi:acyl carrier protein
VLGDEPAKTEIEEWWLHVAGTAASQPPATGAGYLERPGIRQRTLSELEKLTMEAQEIFTKVQETLVDALGVDDDEVTEEATLVGDLGAESIDFLDIVFRLEKNFDVKIPRGELFPENLASADSSFIADGMVTESGIEELRRRMPHADVDKLADDPKVENIQELFTVKMICNFIATKLAG